MENKEIPWMNWCRLCATEDSEFKFYIHSKYNLRHHVSIKEALENFFLLQSSPEDNLPQHLCHECNSVVSSLITFWERVERVQKMYTFLKENVSNMPMTLQNIRKKFKINDVKIKDENCRQTKRETTLSTKLKEDWSVESDQNEIEGDKSRVDIYEEFLDDFKQEHNEDTLDAQLNDNAWHDENEMETIEDSSNDTKQLKTTGHQRKKGNGRKKPNIEDFAMNITCLSCGMDFGYFSAYYKHVDEEHANAFMEKLCPICDRKLMTWYHLGKHMRTHMPKESRFPNKCDECGNNFSSAVQLDLHITRKHKTPLKPYVCEICGVSVASNSALTIHMYSHNGNAPFECEVCKKRFTLRHNLNLHMDIHGSNKYECTICGKQLNSRKTLRNHFYVHSEEKNHKCDYCGSSFKQSKALKAHLILHAGIKPYACNFCDLSFTSRTYCRLHMRKHHPTELAAMEASGKKAYTENVPKLSALKELIKNGDSLTLVATRKIDDGNFGCYFCERRFRHRAARACHIKKKHPEDYADRQIKLASAKAAKSEVIACELCDRKFIHRKLYQSHFRRLHSENVLNDSNDEQYHKDVSDAEMYNELNEAVECLTDNLTNSNCYVTEDKGQLKEVIKLESSPSKTVANIQELFLVIE